MTIENEALDNLLRATGVVDREVFLRLKEAYDYDSASTVGWVEARLRVLASRLDSGTSLLLYDPIGGGQTAVVNRSEFKQWAVVSFPVVAEIIRT